MGIFKLKRKTFSNIDWAKDILSNTGELNSMLNMMPKRIKKLIDKGQLEEASNLEEALLKYLDDYNKAEKIMGKAQTNFNYKRQTKKAAESVFEDQFKRSSSNYSSSSWYDDIFNDINDMFNGFNRSNAEQAAKEKAERETRKKMYKFTQEWFEKNENKLFDMKAEELEKDFLKDLKTWKNIGIITAISTPIIIIIFHLLYQHNLKKARKEAAERRKKRLERQKLYSSQDKEKSYRNLQLGSASISAGSLIGGGIGAATIADADKMFLFSVSDLKNKAEELIKKEGITMTPLERQAFEDEFYSRMSYSTTHTGYNYRKRLENFKYKEAGKFLLPFAAVGIITALIAGWAKDKADSIKKERKAKNNK